MERGFINLSPVSRETVSKTGDRVIALHHTVLGCSFFKLNKALLLGCGLFLGSCKYRERKLLEWIVKVLVSHIL